ncbi:hypothetical protein BMS3Bbin16_01170 [archaeon BMS3Bbin16]|nr:hypothetical protein BMS3Bbin16_01170 [archaeon BMS3Bbin16]
MKAKRNPSRVTISLDEGTAILLEDLKKELNAPRSDVIRRSLHFYSENKQIMRRASKIRSYLELLSSGEHVILDIDHWQLFLNFVEASREKEEFWEGHKKVAKSHGEQFRDTSLKDILERLEACNFYNLREVGSGEFVLIMNSELAKKFVKTFLEEIFSVTGYKVEVREELAKLRVKAL